LRWAGAGEAQGEGAAKDFDAKLIEIWTLRDRAQRYARDVAPYFHPQLAAVKHDHRTADGLPLRPILVIEGYPGDPNKPKDSGWQRKRPRKQPALSYSMASPPIPAAGHEERADRAPLAKTSAGWLRVFQTDQSA
jgi:hypothetical protein